MLKLIIWANERVYFLNQIYFCDKSILYVYIYIFRNSSSDGIHILFVSCIVCKFPFYLITNSYLAPIRTGRNNEASSFYETDSAELGNDDATRPQTSLRPYCSNKVTASDCAHPVSIVTSQRTVHGHDGSVCGFPTCIGSCALLQRRNERANDREEVWRWYAADGIFRRHWERQFYSVI